jgi:hypothetical protein
MSLNLIPLKTLTSLRMATTPKTLIALEVVVWVYMQAMIARLVGWKRKLVSVAISC